MASFHSMPPAGFWCSWARPIAWPNSWPAVPPSRNPRFIVGWSAGIPRLSVPTYDHAPSFVIERDPDLGIGCVVEVELQICELCPPQCLFSRRGLFRGGAAHEAHPQRGAIHPELADRDDRPCAAAAAHGGSIAHEVGGQHPVDADLETFGHGGLLCTSEEHAPLTLGARADYAALNGGSRAIHPRVRTRPLGQRRPSNSGHPPRWARGWAMTEIPTAGLHVQERLGGSSAVGTVR